jgi:hypothetical protein
VMQRGLTPPAPTGPPRTMSQMFDFLRRMQRGQACRLSKDYAGERGRRRVVVRRYGRRVGILQAHPSVNVGRLVRGEIRWVLARAGSICRSASIRASRASGGLPEKVPDFVELSMCQDLHACLSASLLFFISAHVNRLSSILPLSLLAAAAGRAGASPRRGSGRLFPGASS